MNLDTTLRKPLKKKKKTRHLWGWVKSPQHICRLLWAHQYEVTINESVHRMRLKMCDRPMICYWCKTTDSQIGWVGCKTWPCCQFIHSMTLSNFSTSLSSVSLSVEWRLWGSSPLNLRKEKWVNMYPKPKISCDHRKGSVGISSYDSEGLWFLFHVVLYTDMHTRTF